MIKPVRNLYIHIPFCAGECSYCAFYKEPAASARIADWLAALETEMRDAVSVIPCCIETIYMGGGTPSLLEPSVFQQIHTMLAQTFSLKSCREWTVEANPESITPAKCHTWQAAGVTRVSVGVQSLNEPTLQRMRRRHNRQLICQAIAAIKDCQAFELGIDLIAGFPRVADSEWNESIKGVLDFDPDHISVYECTNHPGSSLCCQIEAGEEEDASPETKDQALSFAEQSFLQAGYEHYEVSNYSKPRKRCLHNLAIWRGEDYLGLGPGASSRVAYERWTNRPDVNRYIAESVTHTFLRDREMVSTLQDAVERLMFAFRLQEPVCISDYLPTDPATAHHLLAKWNKSLADLARQGLLTETPEGWQSTPRGMNFSDLIAESLLPDT